MNRKSFRLLLSFTFLLLAFLPLQAQDINAKFDEYLTAITKQGRFMGTVLVARDGKILFSKAYGLANLEWDIPNTPQTKFRLGSITKQFTATAILLLQERGKLNVQDSVCKYLENCPKAWEPITIHHLLNHTSGIPSYTNDPEYPTKSLQKVTPASFVESFKNKPLEFAVGEKYKYNNGGYFILGYLIEKLSGQSYEAFLQDNIFTPLKLANTGYDTHDRILKFRATGYEERSGKPINSSYVDMTIPYAAGSLYSTTEDLFAWNEALFSDKILTAQSRTAMMTPGKGNYGYGLVMNQQFNRQRVSHGGGINGFNTYLARFPAEKITIVALRNANFGVSPDKICTDFAAILFGEKYEIPGQEVIAKVDPKIYDAYVGQYQLGPITLTVTHEGDRLLAQPTGQSKAELFPESETKFFLKVVDAKITFVKDESGKVTHLILHQGGDQKAMKIK